MQIPLDFYRILGVPIRATPEQLQQAFEDRLQQLPRQEYSNAAIAARKQLLEESFVVLADPHKRQEYDRTLSALEEPTSETISLSPQLDLPDNQLAGALLLLQEIGAYPQILEFGTAYLKRPINLAQVPMSAGALEEDVILAMALANLELGREQWQQNQVELAGDTLQKGLVLLEQEQRFSGVQAEIRGDLFKLRPYRILEALGGEDADQRQMGLGLLQAMLDDRDGIDGNQDDQSGLSVNDFLRFIQQLREYLLVEEQQTLFEREAARPSAVASYLAVYALIARGVSDGKPELIQRAKTLLTTLGDRQDIAIEVGMCWLLLGQPESAHHNAKLSQDKDSLEFIRLYSEGASDWIPGLYFYTENWLQQEVYPYFRDLVDRKVSLQQYFDDPGIQSILSGLEPEPLRADKSTGYGAGLKPSAPPRPKALGNTSLNQSPAPIPKTVDQPLGADPAVWSMGSPRSPTPLTDPKASVPRSPSPKPTQSSAPSSQRRPQPARAQIASTEELRQKIKTQGGRIPNRQSSKLPKKRLRKWVPWAIAGLLGTGVVAGSLALGKFWSPVADDGPEPSGAASGVPTTSVPPSFNPSPKPSPFIATGGSSPSSSNRSPSLAGSPPVLSPTEPSPVVTTPGPLSQPDAKQLIQAWQTIKAEAKGERYNTSNLKQVLAQPVLLDWEQRVALDKKDKAYSKYTLHQIEVQSVKSMGQNKAIVTALVKETRQDYVGTKNVSGQTYTDPVQYVVVRQNQQWLIQDMQVLTNGGFGRL